MDNNAKQKRIRRILWHLFTPLISPNNLTWKPPLTFVGFYAFKNNNNSLEKKSTRKILQVIWAELSATFEALSCNSLDVHLLEANPTGLLDTCQYIKVGNVIRLEAKIKNLMQTPGFSSLGELMSLSIKRKKKNLERKQKKSSRWS